MKTLSILLCACGLLFAQNLNSVGLGYAGNYTVMSRGLDALEYNPANLAMFRRYGNEISLVNTSLALGNSSFNLNDYNRFFTRAGHGGTLSVTDREDLLALFGRDGLGFDFKVQSRLFSFVSGHWGAAISLTGQGKGALKPGKPLEMLLFGSTVGDDFGFSEKDVLAAEAYSAVKGGLSYAYRIKLNREKTGFSYLAFGATFNYFAGLGYARTTQSEVSVQRSADNTDQFVSVASFGLQKADILSGGLAGSGFGMDLGITARYKRAVHLSLAVTNVGANIGWSGNARQIQFSQRDTSDIGGTASGSFSAGDTVAINPFSTPLPSTLSLGVSLRLWSPLKIALEYRQGLDTYFGNSKRAQFGAAVLYKPFGWLPLRSGVSVGGRAGFQWGVGMGLHFGPIALDMSYALQGAVRPMEATGVYSGISLRLRY